jgi:hypothetical protein
VSRPALEQNRCGTFDPENGQRGGAVSRSMPPLAAIAVMRRIGNSRTGRLSGSWQI